MLLKKVTSAKLITNNKSERWLLLSPVHRKAPKGWPTYGAALSFTVPALSNFELQPLHRSIVFLSNMTPSKAGAESRPAAAGRVLMRLVMHFPVFWPLPGVSTLPRARSQLYEHQYQEPFPVEFFLPPQISRPRSSQGDA